MSCCCARAGVRAGTIGGRFSSTSHPSYCSGTNSSSFAYASHRQGVSVTQTVNFFSQIFAFCCCVCFAADVPTPAPPGKLVDLGGHRLHVNCTGRGRPIVVVEDGLGDFSFDWTLVQSRVSRFTRICTYDRAGYAWSDSGPMPRTFAQLNLELKDALGKLGERGPYVLVGHSFGGPVVMNFAILYPRDVAGMV